MLINSTRPLKNILTVDVEDYFQGILTISPQEWDRYESRIEKSTEALFPILARTGARATFFVLGHIAAKQPALIRKIQAEGHEIGCHGYFHRPIYEQSEQAFKKDLNRAMNALEDAAGTPIRAYRAPWFSITRASTWAIDILSQRGIVYDASIFPVRTNRYGIAKAPRHPHTIQTKYGPLIELPPATLKLGGFVLPTGGGFYLRTVPYPLIKRSIREMNRKKIPAVIYIHPWELDEDRPRLKVNLMERLIHYTHIGDTETRFRGLLSDFSFGSIGEVFPR